MELVWSQPYRRAERRPRHLMLVAVLCFFLAGLVATGELGRLPFLFRVALAALTGAGVLFFVLGLALLALQKGRRARGARLAAAGPSRPRSERFQQEERR